MKVQNLHVLMKTTRVITLAFLILGAPILTEVSYASFDELCAVPGVLVCEGFDSQTALDWDKTGGPAGKGFFWNGVSPAPGQGTLDTNIKASGDGSLRFNTPDPRAPDGAGTAGQFRQPFGADFGEGDTFYLRWRMRFSPEMLALTAENTGGGQGFKQIIVHRNGSTCAATELTFTNNHFDGYPIWYTACGARGVRNVLDGSRYQRQQGDYASCVYPQNLSSSDCWYYTSNEWLTFYWKVQIGEWGQDNSHLEAWVARGGGPFEKIFDKSDMKLTSSGDYNYVTLTPYMNARADNGTPTHPQAYVWYDELIVSSQPIGGLSIDSGSFYTDSGGSTIDSGSSTADSGSSTADSGSSTTSSGSTSYDLNNLPETIFEDGVENWVVDRFVGNSMAGGLLYQGPAREVGGLQRPWFAREGGDGTIYFTANPQGADVPTLLKVTPDGMMRVVMMPDGLIDGPLEACQAGNPIWNPKENTLYLTGPNCLRRVVKKSDGSYWVEVVAGIPNTPGSSDGSALAATLQAPYGWVCNSRGTVYWLEAKALRKIENGTVSTVPLTRPETPNFLFNFNPGMDLLSLGENDDTLYISSYYDNYGYCILKCDLKTGTLTRLIGIKKENDPYNRMGKETDGPALTHVGFNSGAKGFYDPFHNAIWVDGPDNQRFHWMRLDGDGWVRTVFGARRPETASEPYGLNELNSLGSSGEQFRGVGNVSIAGVDSKGGIFIRGNKERTGLWRVKNIKEMNP